MVTMTKRPSRKATRKAGDALDRQAETMGSISSPEFEQAMSRVGSKPYAEVARSMEETYRNTMEYLQSKGYPTTEEYIQQVEKRRKR